MSKAPKICAWCGKPLGENVSETGKDRISHGICTSCSSTLLSDAGWTEEDEELYQERLKDDEVVR